MILALAVSVVLRSLDAAGAPQLTFRVSPDAMSYQVDAATYAVTAPACVLGPRGMWYVCTPHIPGLSQQTWHSVRACRTVCTPPSIEADVACVCPALSPGGCPSNLFVVSSPPTPPTNLSAAAVSSSQIDLLWTNSTCGADSYKVESSALPTGPWAEIGRVP